MGDEERDSAQAQTGAGSAAGETDAPAGSSNQALQAPSNPPAGGGGRFEELQAKRKEAGLSDAEAEELGRLLAEREGREHSSARSLKGGEAEEG